MHAPPHLFSQHHRNRSWRLFFKSLKEVRIPNPSHFPLHGMSCSLTSPSPMAAAVAVYADLVSTEKVYSWSCPSPARDSSTWWVLSPCSVPPGVPCQHGTRRLRKGIHVAVLSWFQFSPQLRAEASLLSCHRCSQEQWQWQAGEGGWRGEDVLLKTEGKGGER